MLKIRKKTLIESCSSSYRDVLAMQLSTIKQ